MDHNESVRKFEHLMIKEADHALAKPLQMSIWLEDHSVDYCRPPNGQRKRSSTVCAADRSTCGHPKTTRVEL
jgi:hypothetical protein